MTKTGIIIAQIVFVPPEKSGFSQNNVTVTEDLLFTPDGLSKLPFYLVCCKQ